MLSLHEKYIVDADGKKSAIILPYAEWKEVLHLLEEYEDIRAYDKAKAQPSDPISLDEALKKLKDAD